MLKNAKRIMLSGMLITSLSTSALMVQAAKPVKAVSNQNEVVTSNSAQWSAEVEANVLDVALTFEDIKQDFKKSITKAQLKEAKKLFDRYSSLFKEGKYEEADKVWNQIYSKTYINVEDNWQDFNEFKKDNIIPKATKQQLKKAKELYNKIDELYKKGQYEEAEKLWNKLYDMPIIIEDAISADLDTGEKNEFQAGEIFDGNAVVDGEYSYNDDELTVGEATYDAEGGDMEKYDQVITFESIKKMMNKKATAAQLKEAKKLYDRAMAYEKKDQYKEANEIWNQLYSKDYIAYEDNSYTYTFKEFKAEFITNKATRSQISQAKKLFDKATKLEKQGKYDEANEVIKKLHKLPFIKDSQVIDQ